MYVAAVAVVLNTTGMALTGGAPKPYEVREFSAMLAELGGAEAAAEAVTLPAGSQIARAYMPVRDASLSGDLLGGDLLGGPEQAPAPPVRLAQSDPAPRAEPHVVRTVSLPQTEAPCAKKCASIETAAAEPAALAL